MAPRYGIPDGQSPRALLAQHNGGSEAAGQVLVQKGLELAFDQIYFMTD